MTTSDLRTKLDPTRFPHMSAQMAAIVGYLFDVPLTDPALTELSLTPDGAGVLAVPVTADGTRGPTTFLAAVADLRANLARLGMAAGLDAAEWEAFAALVRERYGLDLADAPPGAADSDKRGRPLRGS